MTPEQYQHWIERLADGMDVAREAEPCRREAEEAFMVIFKIMKEGRTAIGPRLVQLATAMPEGMIR